MILLFVPRFVYGEDKSALLISKFVFFIVPDWRITLFIGNKNSIAKQNWSTPETDLVESLKSLVSAARTVLREEHQNNVYESDANKNGKETLKRHCLIVSYNSRSGSTRKVKYPVISID